MTTLDVIKKATARAFAIKDAAKILNGYPDLLATEPRLAEFVRLTEEVRESDRDLLLKSEALPHDARITLERELLKKAYARVATTEHAAMILEGYPELLAAEPGLTEFARLIEVPESIRNPRKPRQNLGKATK